MSKVLIILQAGKQSHEGLARVLHAFLYAKELHENGHETRLIFDGAGAEWLPELMKPDHKLHPYYKEFLSKGLIKGICDFCAGAFKVKEFILGSGLPLISEFLGHPSLARYVAEGYQILIL